MKKSRFKRFVKNFKKDWQLYLLILIPAIYIGIFSYGPMYGIQIAFRDFRPIDGITGSTWVGWKHFERFLNNPDFWGILKNTLVLSLYSMTSFPLSIIVALMLNALTQRKYAKCVQIVSYMPYFISTVVLVGMLNMIFSPVYGVYGNLYRLFGGTGFPEDIRKLPETFRHLYVWSGAWQGLGWSTIIYTAALSGVPTELHEAASIDGASRFKRMIHIDIPCILPTICIMLIMRCGSIISVGFEKAYLMQSPLNKDVSEIISTFVYSFGMSDSRNFSYGAAVGLFNNVVSLAMMVLVNFITKKLSQNEISFF